MPRDQHGTISDIHGKVLQAAGTLFRATAPERNPGPIANDLEEAPALLRIAANQLEIVRATNT